jgi:hypothetical protein
MRNVMRALGIAAMTLAMVLPIGAAAWADSAPYCGITWGSRAKSGGGFDNYVKLTNVRAGRHACFDRLVLDLNAGQEHYSVGYVDQVRQPEGGPVVPLRGGARLAIFAEMHYTYPPPVVYHPKNAAELVDVAGWRTFRQVALAYQFEYGTGIGLGVRARLPFRVFALDGPDGGSRLVIDVAHRW